MTMKNDTIHTAHDSHRTSCDARLRGRPGIALRLVSRLPHALLVVGIVVLAHQLALDKASSRVDDFRDDHTFVRGDSNDDESLDISDALRTLGYLFQGDNPPPCVAAADCDDDGELTVSDPILFLNYLFKGEGPPMAPFPDRDLDPTPDLGCRGPAFGDLPPVGSEGGPDRVLDDAEVAMWLRGRQFFDQPATRAGGLGPTFNGDSCRACHLDPVIGGAGGLDVNVVRFAYKSEDGVEPMEGGPAASRLAIHGVSREEMPAEANVVETRQTPTVFGLGLLDRVADETILALADPDDGDGDGISGRARMVGDQVGRFGHKAGVPTLFDFAADALFNELGLTVHASHSAFAVSEDDDGVTDPEVADGDLLDLAFFISHLASPGRLIPDDPGLQQSIAAGETLFETLGCGSCHVPALDGADGPVAAFTDLLLHDVAAPDRVQVNEPGVEPREFRTAPLWGVRDTAPYLHDGSAETLDAAIRMGHFGEADASRQAYEALFFLDQVKVLDFLRSL